MLTLAGVAKLCAERIRAGGLAGTDPITILAGPDPAAPIAPGDKQDSASLHYDPRTGRGECRLNPGGRFADRCSFWAESPAAAEADDDLRVAALARLREDLSAFAGAEFTQAEARA